MHDRRQARVITAGRGVVGQGPHSHPAGMDRLKSTLALSTLSLPPACSVSDNLSLTTLGTTIVAVQPSQRLLHPCSFVPMTADGAVTLWNGLKGGALSQGNAVPSIMICAPDCAEQSSATAPQALLVTILSSLLPCSLERRKRRSSGSRGGGGQGCVGA